MNNRRQTPSELAPSHSEQFPESTLVFLTLGYLLAAVLASTRAGGSTVVVGDLILVAVVIFDLLRRQSIKGNADFAVPLYLLIATAVGLTAFGHLVSHTQWFSLTELLISAVRFPFYVFAASQFAVTVRRFGLPNRTIRIFTSLAVVAVAAQLLVALQYLSTFPLVSDPTVKFDRFSGLPRLFGVFSEPSTAAILYSALILYVVHSGNLPFLKKQVAALCILLGLTFALTAVLIMAFIALDLLLSTMKNPARTLKVAGSLIALLLALLSFGPTRAALDGRVFDRVQNIEADASATARLTDSWAVSLDLSPPPFIGLGLGQYSERVAFADATGELEQYDPRFAASGAGWNVFAGVLAEIGVLGLLAFLTITFRSLDRTMLLMMVGIGFSTGAFVGWLFWCTMGVAQGASKRSRWRDSHKNAPLLAPEYGERRYAL